MKKFSCTSCGAEVVFKSSVSVYVTCSYCQATLFKDYENLNLIDTQSLIVEDNTPIKIGTTGKYQGLEFVCIGKTRLAWQDGFWNEWYLQFLDSRVGWLFEAQGSFGISFEVDKKIDNITDYLMDFYSNENSKLESGFIFEDNTYNLVDRKKAKYIEFKGELPKVLKLNSEVFSIDFSNSYGHFANISYELDSTKYSVFVGTYLDFEDLSFANLNEFEGWKCP